MKISRVTATDTAGREQEPVDEDAFAFVLEVVRQHAVPLVLLLTPAVSAAALRARPTETVYKYIIYNEFRIFNMNCRKCQFV